LADSEISILIKAVDEATATIKKVESTIENSNKNIQKQTLKTTDAFSGQIKTLMALGNIASGVDNIFSSYTNLQLRLENATERVTGAQERLIAAEEKLRDVQQGNKRILMDLEKLNLEESRTISKLEKDKRSLANMEKGIVLPTTQRYRDLLQEVQDEELKLKDIQLTISEKRQKQNQDLVTAQRDVEAANRSLTISENNLARANNQVIGTYINMGTQALSVVASLNMLRSTAILTTGSMGGLTTAIGIGGLAATGGAAAALVGLIAVMYLTQEVGIQHEKELEAIRVKYNLVTESAKKTAEAIWLVNNAMDNQKKTRSDMMPKLPAGTPTTYTLPQTNQSGVFQTPKLPGLPQNDFISRPGQNAVPFSSNDTIIGMKNPGQLRGINIYITGNIYGTDPDEISDAIMTKLRRKVSI
jgi:hypothetical protein